MKKFILLIISYAITTNDYANTVQNPCSGPNSLLNLINRPTYADSACVVPAKKLLFESGYLYQDLINSNGVQQNAPSLVVRLGLPDNNEVSVLVPNYIHQKYTPTNGWTATTLSVKRVFGYPGKWIIAGEGFVTLPDGSASFGSAGLDTAINGIVSYTFNDKFNVMGVFGGSTQTLPRLYGGQHYASINPDVVFTYSFTDSINFYAEAYGQSHTGPGQGWGVNSDFGVLYLINPSVVVDLEVGKRLTGSLDGFERYIGAGISFILG